MTYGTLSPSRPTPLYGAEFSRSMTQQRGGRRRRGVDASLARVGWRQEMVLRWKGQVQMKVGESTGTGSVGVRTGAAVGGRLVHRKWRAPGRRRRRWRWRVGRRRTGAHQRGWVNCHRKWWQPGGGDGSGQVHRKWRGGRTAAARTKTNDWQVGGKIKEYLMALVAMDGTAVAMF